MLTLIHVLTIVMLGFLGSHGNAVLHHSVTILHADDSTTSGSAGTDDTGGTMPG